MEVVGPVPTEHAPVLTLNVLEFIGRLVDEFGPRRDRLLEDRYYFREEERAGRRLVRLPETAGIRESEWSVPAPPEGLASRTVELLGPADPRSVVTGLNAKANVYVADFEDLHSPTWEGTLQGHRTLARAARGTLEYTAAAGERFRIVRHPATLMVRPRAWHRSEPHVVVDGRPVPAALFDFGTYVFLNARDLVERGRGPYFYLPKLERYLEAALWEEIFRASEVELRLPPGTIRATPVIETLSAANEVEEILFALRSHAAGLAFGRQGYILSFLKQFQDNPTFHPPNRAEIGVDTPFVAEGARRVVQAGHRRGTLALSATPLHLLDLESGGPRPPAIARELAEKVREAREGFDGTWLTNPEAVAVVREFFALRRGLTVAPTTPVDPMPSPASEVDGLAAVERMFEGTRTDVRSSLRYYEAWARGAGSVVVDHRVEDASTIEVARTLLWLWTRYRGPPSTSTKSATPSPLAILDEECAAMIRDAAGDTGQIRRIRRAAQRVKDLATKPYLREFLTSGRPKLRSG
ncbi:MAG: malate synthase A [Thermoplasmata archaeon]|nr:malate synthase A [Thermoplasmata archaeon]